MTDNWVGVTHAQQTVQQGVVVGQGLARRGGGGGSDFGVVQVAEFLTGPGGFGFDIIHDGTCRVRTRQSHLSSGLEIIEDID